MKNHWNKKVTLKYKNCGSNWAVYVEGETVEDVEQEFWGFWNWGVTNGEFEWLTEAGDCPQSGYFWVTTHGGRTAKQHLTDGLFNRAMTYLLNTTLKNEFKNQEHGLAPIARKIVASLMDEMVQENQLSRAWSGGGVDYHELGTIEAHRPDGSDVHTDWNTSHTNIFHKLGLTTKP